VGRAPPPKVHRGATDGWGPRGLEIRGRATAKKIRRGVPTAEGPRSVDSISKCTMQNACTKTVRTVSFESPKGSVFRKSGRLVMAGERGSGGGSAARWRAMGGVPGGASAVLAEVAAAAERGAGAGVGDACVVTGIRGWGHRLWLPFPKEVL